RLDAGRGGGGVHGPVLLARRATAWRPRGAPGAPGCPWRRRRDRRSPGRGSAAMTDASIGRPRVRRRFIIALLVVLPFLVHAVWDYVETRRLNEHVEAIIGRGEPVSTVRYVELGTDASRAERSYRALSALAGDLRLSQDPRVTYRLSRAMRQGQWTPADVGVLRAL